MVPFEFHVKWMRDRSMNHIRSFNRDKVFFTPIARSPILVVIGDRPYAGYDSEREATDAIELWKRFWPAAEGITFRVVRRF